MPVFFAIILFFNSHILLLLFLHFSAIILKLCSKKSQFSNTYNECNYKKYEIMQLKYLLILNYYLNMKVMTERPSSDSSR